MACREQFSRDLPGLLEFAKALVSELWDRRLPIDFSQPMLIVPETEPGPAVVIAPQYDGGQQGLNNMLAVLQRHLHEQGTIRCARVTEVWFNKCPQNAPLPELRPSRDPNRQEAVMIIARDADGNRLGSTAEIKRNVKGRPRLCLWEDLEPHTDCAGLLGVLEHPDELADWLANNPMMAQIIERDSKRDN